MKLVGFSENYLNAEKKLQEALNAVHFLMISFPNDGDKEKYERLCNAAGFLQEGQSYLIKGRNCNE